MTALVQSAQFTTARNAPRAVLLFDDRCSVCRRFLTFVIGLDRVGQLRIAPLQSLFGDTIRATHVEFSKRDSALFVQPDGTILAYSDAILATLEQVGGLWRTVARLLHRVPRRLRDRVYTAFATHRSVFGALGLPSVGNWSLSHAVDRRHESVDKPIT